MAHIEITGPPTLERQFLGRPLRVPVNQRPDETWHGCLREATPRDAIRLTQLDGASLLVFPSQQWDERPGEVLDVLVGAIGRANKMHVVRQRRRAELAEAERRRREEDQESAGDDLAAWWQGHQAP